MIRQFANQKVNLIAVIFGAAAAVGGISLGLLIPYISDLTYLVLGLVGLAIVGVVVFRIEWGLYALVIMTYLHLSDVLIKFHNAPSIAKIFVPLLLGLVIFRWILLRERPSAGWERSGILMGSYALVIAASFLFASDPDKVQVGLIDFFKNGLVAILVTMILVKAVNLRGVIWSLLAVGIFLGSITTYQALTGAFDNNFWGFAQPGEVTFGSGYRIAGPVNTNFYALILVVLVPLALGRLRNEESIILRLAAFWALSVCLISILFTYSRGGFLALAVVLGLMIARQLPRPSEVFALIILGVVIWQYLPDSYVERLTTITSLSPSNSDTLSDNSLRGRTSEMMAAWFMFADQPLTGVGYLNYEVNYLDYSEDIGLDPRREERQPHNLYLEIAAETGLVGLGVFGAIMWFLFAGINNAKRNFQNAGMPYYAQIAGEFQIALVGYFAGSLFLHALYPRYFWLLIGIGLAIPFVATYELSKRKVEITPPRMIKETI